MKKLITILIFILCLCLIGVILAQSSGEAEAQSMLPRVFLPSIMMGDEPFKGLAIADMDHFDDIYVLGGEWWYDWTSPLDLYSAKVPMLWSGLPSTNIPSDYTGWILAMNEPNVSTQLNITPSEAVSRLNALRTSYPYAKILCCGVSIWAGDWTEDFWDLGGRPDAWHVHAYTEEWITPTFVQSELTEWHTLTGGDYWISEFGSPAGSLSDFQAVMTWFEQQSWITRVSAYTNRQPEGAPWAIGEGVEMVNDDGTLTPIGEWYAGR
jgi:hypothetical protein